MFCWREFKSHPVYSIGPLNIEFLSRNPDIIRVYDFLGDQMLEELKSHYTVQKPLLWTRTTSGQGFKDMESSTNTNDGQSGKLTVRDNVVSLWYAEDIKNATWVRFLKKIESFTGLRVWRPSWANSLQLKLYGFSAFFGHLHFDAKVKWSGQRLQKTCHRHPSVRG